MATLPKMPIPNNERHRKPDMSMVTEDESVKTVEKSNVHEPIIVPDVPQVMPNLVETDGHDLAETDNLLANSFNREFQTLKKFVAEEAGDLENNIKANSPYIIGAMIAAPVQSMSSNIRKMGFINFLHRTSTRSKLAQLTLFASGIAAYHYNKPQMQRKFLKEFKDA